MTHYLEGIRIGREAIERCHVLDEWPSMSDAIGAEWCEFATVYLDGRRYMAVCDEEYHVRGVYRKGDPVTDFDNVQIFGTCLLFKLRDHDAASIPDAEASALLAKLPQCVRRIAEGIA